MRTATFLFLKTGLNLFKPGVDFSEALAKTPSIEASLNEPVIQLSEHSQSEKDELIGQGALKGVDSEVIHIGPRGGRYRLDEAGRKIYLKAA